MPAGSFSRRALLGTTCVIVGRALRRRSCALAPPPHVLLADEPVASLDVDKARRVLAILRRCADDGLAVAARLQQRDLAKHFADRVVRPDPLGAMT